MLRLRCRSTAALVLALVFVLASAAPLAAAPAAPFAPAAGSWWSSLAVAFDGLLGSLGWGDARRVSAPEGSALEPDGMKPNTPCLPGQKVGCDADGDTLSIAPQPDDEASSLDPKR